MSQAEQTDVSRYYDLLHLWTRLNKGFRAFSGIEARAIHRWLDHPDSGDFSPATIHAIMLAGGLADTPIAALDAGCGYGGTMFALQAALGGCWHGITISPRQCAVGAKAARQKGLADAVTFACGSYDEPQTPGYNLIYGIESLVHSIDPARTVANLAGALRPGGTFIIVDDMPVDPVPAEFAGDLAGFKAAWRCPVMPSATQWSAHLAAAQCDVVDTRALHDDPGAQAAVVQFSASLPAILLRHCPRKRAIQYARDSIRILFPSISTACVYWIARFRGQ